MNESEHKEPWIKAPQQLYLLRELLRVRNKSSLLFFESRRFGVIKASSFGLCQMVCVFSKQQLILTKFNRPGNFKGMTGFRKLTELYP